MLVILQSVITILFEIPQIRNDEEYFKDFWNIMDIVGNLSIIGHTTFLFAQVHNVDSKIDYGMIMLVIGTGTIGLRSISQLR